MEAKVPVSEKFMLTIQEAAEYFNLGERKVRRLAEENLGKVSVQNGRKVLIVREKMEKFLSQVSSV